MVATMAKSVGGRSLVRALADARLAMAAIAPRTSAQQAEALARLSADAEAAAFHAELLDANQLGRQMLLAVLGGTGTGKSTLVNRLCAAPDYGEQSLTATSFRRTFTAGPVAIAGDGGAVPGEWMGLPHATVERAQLPARGRADHLLVVPFPSETTRRVTLIDTPDLDGDAPEHHQQADRVFRWCEAVLFVTTPEKYQMTELLAYYRLASRYGVPALYVMNKVDDLAAANDWRQQLSDMGIDVSTGGVTALFVVPRDDAGFTAPPEQNLEALRAAAAAVKRPAKSARAAGISARAGDLAGRIADQLLAPLRARRAAIESAKTRLDALVRPETGVDVHPMTRHLQRRLQQQSVLYLMGPARVLDRLRTVPAMVARLPRSTWDLLARGRLSTPEPTTATEPAVQAPDFRGELMDGLRLVQSRIADLLTQSNLPAGEASWRLDPALAGDIATDELDELRRWLEQRWNAKPRDTRTLEKLLKAIPGSQHLTKLSEAAPYLLAATCATTSALFGPVDQVVIGGYLLTTWLSEKLSNEVAGKTRETNRRIAARFNDLCERQVEHVQVWLDTLAPTPEQLDALERAGDALVMNAYA